MHFLLYIQLRIFISIFIIFFNKEILLYECLLSVTFLKSLIKKGVPCFMNLRDNYLQPLCCFFIIRNFKQQMKRNSNILCYF